MQFEYTQYLKGCLLLPAAISIATLALFLPPLFRFIVNILTRKMMLRDYGRFLFTIALCSFFLCMNIGRLSHGGLKLINENESDAVEVSGRIIEIIELGRCSFPELNSEHNPRVSNGVQIVLDSGIVCTAITYGPFVIGDNVTIIYMPQSRYVLSIQSLIGHQKNGWSSSIEEKPT